MNDLEHLSRVLVIIVTTRIIFVCSQRIPAFPELVKVLSHFCCNPDPADKISFESAVLLGMLCVSDDNARSKLLVTLEKSGDTHRIAKV